MKWIETKVVFDFHNPDFAVELIANIFFELGLPGVSLEEPQRDLNLDWEKNPRPLPDHYAVIGYLPGDDQFDTKCKAIEESLQRIKGETGVRTRIQYAEIAEKEWAESWKEFFHPLKIGDKVVVKPTWRKYVPEAQEIMIELDPGMAFGTGTHPTTSLCIQMIEKYIQAGDSVLDIGAGSGILMLAAVKLGAGYVCGVDEDKNAVEIARQNLILNKIDASRFKVQSGNLVDGVHGRFDLVTANILTGVILQLLDDLKRVLVKNGRFICSGIVEKSASLVVEKMRALGFEILESHTQEEWVAIVGRVTKN